MSDDKNLRKNIINKLTQEITKKTQNYIEIESSKDFSVAVLGQTGVGKTTLINVLFGTTLKTDAVIPTTKIVQPVEEKTDSGSILRFYDMPGIGESSSTDLKYLQQYKNIVEISDVVIWAIHSDVRSVTFDINNIKTLLDSFESSQRVAIFQKIVFVMTKCDLIHPDPWMYILLDKEKELGFMNPSKLTKALLNQKMAYFQREYILPYVKDVKSVTFKDIDFQIDDPRFTVDKHTVSFNGVIKLNELEDLIRIYPQAEKIFRRLYDNYTVIPVSSTIRYNLKRLMIVIINKLGQGAIHRFYNFSNKDNLSRVTLSDAKMFSNLEIYDNSQNEYVFSLVKNIGLIGDS